jgi:oligopeptide/dipeptide ABC transporter ATP-binding protein
MGADVDAALLDIAGLNVTFDTEAGPRAVLHNVSLLVQPGEILGLVGESGSGKSVTALAIIRLLADQGRITAGRVTLAGVDLLRLNADAMRDVRGRDVAMIFQEPMTSLNPLLRIGLQIEESLNAHLGLRGRRARDRGIELLAEVGLPADRYDEYPHALSGGQRQRVMIAIAMACSPRLLIADEPTTALDVSVQAQILALMRRQRADHGTAILLITHDMGVIAQMADRVAVMYAGEIVETAPVGALLAAPAHPYTRLLLDCIPTTRERRARLPMIQGQMPAASGGVAGCRFRERCPIALPACADASPPLDAFAHERGVRCWRAHQHLES